MDFDTTVFTTKAAAGYVIRNCHGDFIFIACKAISLYMVSYAEIVDAWMGLFAAIKMLHYTDVFLEDDFSYATSIIDALSDQINQHNVLLLDIKSWIQ